MLSLSAISLRTFALTDGIDMTDLTFSKILSFDPASMNTEGWLLMMRLMSPICGHP